METLHPQKLSAAHAMHVALHAVWSESSDWRVPQSYGNPEAEVRAAMAGVGLQDVSDIGKLDVKGFGLEETIGGVSVSMMSAVLRIKPGHAIVITPPMHRTSAYEALEARARASSACAHVTDITSALAAFMLIG